MAGLFNRARVGSITAGTGSFTLGSAVVGHQTFAQAGVTNGTVVRYVAETDGRGEWEVGQGTYSSSGPTLTRTTIYDNSNDDSSAVNFSAPPQVWIDYTAAQDIVSSVTDFGALGDGVTDDTDAIQACFDAVPSAGGAVYVPGGKTYALSDAISLKSNTTLAAGPGAVFKFSAVSTTVHSQTGPVALTNADSSNTNISVFGLKVDTSLIDGGNKAIGFYGCTKTRVRDCVVVTSGQAIIHVNCSDYWVESNDILATDIHGPILVDQWWGSHDGHILRNTIDGGSLAVTAILFTGTQTQAISAPIHYLEIDGNTIRNCNKGIWAQGSIDGVGNIHNCLADRNIIADCDIGILIDDNVRACSFSLNTFENIQNYAIGLRQPESGGAPTHNNIIGNSIEDVNLAGSTSDAGAAILLAASSGASDNVIALNTIKGSTHYYGIRANVNCNNNFISPNNIDTAVSADISDAGTGNIQFQPLDADLTSWAGVTRASGFDTFAATPSSANLASLVTGETGSGALVFGTSPTLDSPSVDDINLTGGQIAFPATQNASSGANTLDDYEEGTFTPAIAFVGGTTGITYSSQEGRYTKVGKLVAYNIRIVLTSKGSDTGNMTYTGLPFTVQNANAARFPAAVVCNNITYTGEFLSGWPLANSTTGNIIEMFTGTSSAPLDDTNFANNTFLTTGGFYEASA